MPDIFYVNILWSSAPHLFAVKGSGTCHSQSLAKKNLHLLLQFSLTILFYTVQMYNGDQWLHFKQRYWSCVQYRQLWTPGTGLLFLSSSYQWRVVISCRIYYGRCIHPICKQFTVYYISNNTFAWEMSSMSSLACYFYGGCVEDIDTAVLGSIKMIE